MFETSLDLLYGAIALCVIIFTGFLVWVLFYIAQILRQGNEVIREIREKIAEFEEALASIREKVVNSATALTFISREIGNIVELVKTRKEDKSKRKK